VALKNNHRAKNEVVCKSNRLKKPPGTKNIDFFIVNKVTPLCNFSPNGVTRKEIDINLLNIFHQNIRRLRGKANELLSHLYPAFPHILCSTEHHIKLLELQQLNI
jgi:hypothetical protein